MLFSFINMAALESFVLLLMIKINMSTCQDVIDGNTNNNAFYYLPFYYAWQCFLVMCGMSSSISTIFALFSNPLWFLALQLPNLLLYYECIHRPYNLKEKGIQGLQVNTDENLPILDRKKEAQTFFICAFTDFFILALLFRKHIRSLLRLLFREDRFQDLDLFKLGFWKNLGKKVKRFQILACASDIARSVFFCAALMLKSFFLMVLGFYDRLCFVLDLLRFRIISLSLLSNGSAILMHVFAFHSFYHLFFLNISSPVIITKLILSTICLLSHYRLLDCMLNDILFKLQSIARLLCPLYLSTYGTVLSSVTSIIQNISSKFSRQISIFFAFILGNNLHRPILTVPKYIFSCIGFALKTASRCILGKKWTDKITSPLVSIHNMIFTHIEDFLSIYSSIYVSWLIREQKQVENASFVLNPQNIPHTRFLEEVWIPHCQEFLDLPHSFYPYSNPDIGEKKGQTKSGPAADFYSIFSADDRVIKVIDVDTKKTVHSPLYFNDTNQTRDTEPVPHLSLQEIAAFFLSHDDVLERFSMALENSDDFTLSSEMDGYLRTTITNRFEDKLTTYIDKWLNVQGNLKRSTMSSESRKEFDISKENFLNLISHEIMAYQAQHDNEQKMKHKNRACRSIEIFLKHIHLCAVGIKGGLDDASYVLDLDVDLSATSSKYRQMRALKMDIKSQRISQQVRNGDVGTALSHPDYPTPIGREFDSFLPIIPFGIINPNWFLLVQLYVSSLLLQGIEAANRHSDVISKAILGDVSTAENATFERNALSISIPWLHAFNLETFHQAQPTGWQLRHDLNLLDLTNPSPLMPLDYFGPDNDQRGDFYREFCDYLEEVGYLLAPNIANTKTNENRLADLLDAQANIHKSPLRSYALIQCLGYVGIEIEDITWQRLAKIIHAIDNDKIPEDTAVVKDGAKEISGKFTLEFLRDRTKAVAVDLLKNPRYYSEKINMEFERLHVRDIASKKARLRCLCQADDLNFLSNKTASITPPGESSKTENRPPVDASAFFDFLMLEQESGNYSKGADYDDVYQTMDSLCEKESMRFMLNKFIVAPLFTLLLHHGIMYRGATANDPQPNVIYQDLNQLRQSQMRTSQLKYTYVDRVKQCFYIVKLTVLMITNILIPTLAKTAHMLIKLILDICMSLILGSIKTIVYTFPLSFYQQNYFYVRSALFMLDTLYDRNFIYSQTILTILKPVGILSYRVLRTFALIPFMVLSCFKSIAHRLIVDPIVISLHTLSKGPMHLFYLVFTATSIKTKAHHDLLSSSDLIRSKIKRAKRASKHLASTERAFQPKVDIMETMSDDLKSSLEFFSGMLPSM